jgi:hypothetical protein
MSGTDKVRIWPARAKEVRFTDLLGSIITKIENIKDKALVFYVENEYGNDKEDEIFYMSHSQECCEDVYIESITGDIDDLIGLPILRAAEAVSIMELSQEKIEALDSETDNHEKMLWTFYKLSTIKGYVDIRWQGNSNGYYSVSVDFVRITPEELESVINND